MNIMTINKLYSGEKILSDNHPVYYGYLYLCDSRIVSSDIEGKVSDLKHDAKCNEVRNCDLAERNLWEFYQ